MVGFVINSSVPDDLSPLQFYIYSSLIEIFGNDVKKNINFLLTSAESEDPFLWSDVVDCKLVTCGPFREHEQNRHKFNSSAILSSKLQSDSNCFDEWMKNMAEFLNFSLGGAKTKSITNLKQGHDEDNRLVATGVGLLERMQTDMAKLIESIDAHVNMENYVVSNDDNILFQLNVTERVSSYLSFGEYANNCEECQMTCHRGDRTHIGHCTMLDSGLKNRKNEI